MVFLVVGGLLLGTAGWYGFHKVRYGATGADIHVTTGGGGMPPGEVAGTPLEEEFTVVFTEPFPTLDRWQEAKERYRVTTGNGTAHIDLPPGQYGVYAIYQGKSQLYHSLKLGGTYRSTVKMSQQGPWYIEVQPGQRLDLGFGVNQLPV